MRSRSSTSPRRCPPTTPVLQLPAPFANTIPLSLEKVSDFDDDGPFWGWNNIHTGEHTGTHVDAPAHWATGRTRRRSTPSRRAGWSAWPSSWTSPSRPRPTPTSCSNPSTWTPTLPSTARSRRAPGCCSAPAGAGSAGQGRPGLRQRRRRRPAHPWCLRRRGAVAGRLVDHRLRRGDRRHRRRPGRWPRAALPGPPLPARRGQVRPDPAAEPGPAAAHRRPAGRLAAARGRRHRLARASVRRRPARPRPTPQLKRSHHGRTVVRRRGDKTARRRGHHVLRRGHPRGDQGAAAVRRGLRRRLPGRADLAPDGRAR